MMGNETVFTAVLGTLAFVVLIFGVAMAVRSVVRDRRVERDKQGEALRLIVDALKDAIETSREVSSTLASNGKAMQELSAALTSSINSSYGSLAELIKTGSMAVSSSLNPESQKRFQDSADRLSTAIDRHASDIESFGDSGRLMATSCRKMNENIVALRAIVFGGRRAEEFSLTADDPENIRRADIENDIAMLMQDHDIPREEATRRVKNLYSTRPIGVEGR